MTVDRWQQVERVCHSALEHEAEARGAFLDEACAGDADLRREVESLLAEQLASEGFLAMPALEAAAVLMADAPHPSLAGRALAHYRIDAFLRAGGMGQVYRAWDTKLGREVAIKVLPAELAGGRDHLARFEREARALAELNHPNILAIYDVGTFEATPFVVTELLEGETLREILSHREPTTPQVLSCVVQAARGLAAAHRKGIVHRDIKPENLFLTTDGRIKILDFGLARHAAASGLGADDPQDSPVTHAGLLLGTLAYMSPEQVNAQAVDARSDVFSLGVVLHEMLARKHPFRRDAIGATLNAIVHETPPDLSGVVPPALGLVVRRCLKKNRDERFRDAHDLLLALEGIQQAPSAAASLGEIEERGPYPGLRSFTEDDADVFFGREDEIEAFWGRIQRQPLLAVIGSSGAGKTSFMRAGVIPARPDGWAAVACTPGPAPMRGLGQALAPELTGDLEALRQLVSFDDSASAFGLLKRWRRAHAEALVVIDQFEELFTLNPPDVQANFSGFLARVATDADIHVVVALRDDFLIRCCEQPSLAPVLTQLTALLPLGRNSLRRALVEPATEHGYRFEDEALVDEMLGSVAGTRAALPLLAFAVARLWERRDRERQLLTRSGYHEIGGVAGALAQHAEAVLDTIGADRHDVVREVFRALVTPQGTRAVVGRGDLLSACPARGVAEEVLEALLQARLLTSYEVEGVDGRPGHDRVEIAHESLLGAWPRLTRWQTQDEGSAQMRDQLRQAAHLWAAKGRSADLLWRGLAFREFALWHEQYASPLTPVERDFAAAMVRRALRTKRVRQGAVLAVVAGLSLVVLAVAISRQSAVEHARRALASKLVALGRLEIDRSPTAAVAYARASLEVSDTIEARLLALEALWRGPTARILTLPEAAACTRVAFSPGGDTLACAGFPDKVVVWRDTGQVAHIFARLPTMADTRAVTFDARGQRLLSWVPADSLLRIWSLASGEEKTIDASAEWVRPLGPEEVATVGPAGPGARERVLRRWSLANASAIDVARWMPPAGMRFNQPGLRPERVDRALRWLAFGDGHDVVLRRLAPPGGADRRLERHGVRVREVVFDEQGERLLSLDESGLFCLWSAAGGQLLRELPSVPPHRYSVPVFSPDGSRVSWTAGDGTTYLWELLASPEDPPLRLQRTDVRDAGDEAFDPRGRWLAAAGWSSVALWPIRLPHVSALSGHVEGPILDLAFSPDSSILASCARDGALLWPLDASGARKRRVELGGDYYCYGVEFAPDRRTLVLNVPFLGTYLVPLDGGPARVAIDFRGKRAGPMPSAFDPSGRHLAVGIMYAPVDADMQLHVLDLETAARRTVPLRRETSTDGYASAAYYLRYLANGQLLIGGSGGIRRWDPESGAIEPVIWGDRFAALDSDRAGRTVVAVLGEMSPSRQRLIDPELVVLDANGAIVRKITTHGNALTPTIAVDTEGRFVVTGDANGIVRVGALDGSEPHVLFGHTGTVNRVAVSPDRRWIASSSGREIRLWPMPDLAKAPLHTLPRADLVAILESLTNLRVVSDAASLTGWAVQVGPFPGWRDVPTW